MPYFHAEDNFDTGRLLAGLQPADPAGVAQKLLGVREQQANLDVAPAVKALTEARAKETNLLNEQRQMDIESQRIGIGALRDANNADEYLQLLGKRGASPRFVAEAHKAIADAKLAAVNSDAKKLEYDNARHDQLIGDLTSMEGMPEEQRRAGWPQLLQQWARNGHLTPEEYRTWAQQHPDYPGSATVNQVMIPGLKLGSQITKDAQAQQQIAASKAAQKASEAQTTETQQKTRKEKLMLAAQTAPDNAADWANWYATLDPEIKVMVPAFFSPAALDKVRKMGLTPAEIETNRHNKVMEGLQANNVTEAELSKIATDPTKSPEERAAANAALKRLDQSKMASRPQVNVYPGVPMSATGATAELHGEDYLKTLPPAFAARVRKVISGDEPFPTGRQANTGAGLQLVNAVYQTEPGFTPLLASARKQALQEFGNTQVSHAGGQRLALNTLIHHADLFLEVADALKNGSWRPGNAVYNKVAAAFGSTPPVETDLVARFLAGETGKVATGGVPAEGEINGLLQSLNKDNSPQQLHKVGSDILRIAAGRMVPLKELRDKNNLQNLVDILGPHAKEILERRGYDPETLGPRQGGGGPVQHKVGDTVYFNGQARVIKEIKPNGNLVLQ